MRIYDRILAVSDVHGENTKFLELLKKADYEPEKDLLIVCGDLVDRGEENLATINTCMNLQSKGAVVIKGNHEKFLEICLREMITNGVDGFGDTFTDNFMLWVGQNRGASTFEEIKNLPREKLIEIYEFVKNLPLYFSTGDYIFSHTGGNSSKTFAGNTEDEWLWGLKWFSHCPAYKGKITIFGHTPTWLLYPYSNDKRKNKEYRTKSKIWFDPINRDKIGIDCGSVFGGRMGAIELPSYFEFYV